MFKKGDKIRIKKEFLADYEDPKQDYFVIESYEDITKVYCLSEKSFLGYYVYAWGTHMFYKVEE
jgi:hypothetical protein